ncbi:lipophorin receptor [Sarcoptes scabiei]|uniref:DNA replication licensing factor MCM3 n=1 Tax=Sarcoptes scabiei TaxID=52283 RepID=A0A132AAP5_SARSC|nr:DNA replication licensing factor Mcm3-like protein [Sarcoptes scabiei]UXI21871.1 lipophorin receptor [Sarcoptes scabiei]
MPLIDIGPDASDAERREKQSQYLDFLDDENDQGIYSTAIKHMIKTRQQRLIVNINDLRRKLPSRTRLLLKNGIDEIVLFQNALRDYISHHAPDFLEQYEEFLIGLEGSFGSHHVTPRNLSTNLLGCIIAVEGIVTRCSIVRPKIVRSVHYCPATKKKHERRFTDLTSLSAFPSSSAYPTKDEDGNLLETEFGLSTYKDHQILSIQEMPEKAPAGQLPRSIDIIADDDLVDTCKPGDRVLIVGPYRCLPNKQGYYTSGTFRTVVLANNINQLNKEVKAEIMREDIKRCQRFSRNKDVFEILARSLAPSIYGHEYIKKALLCMLLGGLEKILPNGTRLRGDINVLLIGDPSVSKSQLLRYVLHCAPRAVATTGRGSSGVGLTAAVTTDPETGDRRLEAGAMVLADRGVVCIDEFDKMSDIDRTAIHEVMEQGQVTITKAGIQARLNARCSVLAAANPVYGRYDQYKTPHDNIGMQDSLLSRFDLLFIMLDKNDIANDTEISEHVVRVHRYRQPGEQDGEPLPIISSADFLSTKNPDKMDDEEQETVIFEKYDPLLHGKRKRNEKFVTIDFMRKYVHIAKQIKPMLTKEAIDIIAEEYSKLRVYDLEMNDVCRTQPITARTMETLIRLSTAHARARLSKVIEAVDAKAAVEMVQFSHFQKVLEKPHKRKRVDGADSDAESNEEDFDEMYPEETKASQSTGTKSRPKKQDEDTAIEMMDDKSISKNELTTTITAVEMSIPESEIGSISDSRLKEFRQILYKIFRDSKLSSIPIDQITEKIMKESAKLTKGEVKSALSLMQDRNQIFIADNMVILI